MLKSEICQLRSALLNRRLWLLLFHWITSGTFVGFDIVFNQSLFLKWIEFSTINPLISAPYGLGLLWRKFCYVEASVSRLLSFLLFIDYFYCIDVTWRMNELSHFIDLTCFVCILFFILFYLFKHFLKFSMKIGKSYFVIKLLLRLDLFQVVLYRFLNKYIPCSYSRGLKEWHWIDMPGTPRLAPR